jgi:hypothetical protein
MNIRSLMILKRLSTWLELEIIESVRRHLMSRRIQCCRWYQKWVSRREIGF